MFNNKKAKNESFVMFFFFDMTHSASWCILRVGTFCIL